MGRATGWPRPRVVVSRCLGFESCRYDGSIVECALVEELKPFVDFLPICPEVGAGLGIPRRQIRVVMSGHGPRLVEPETGMDRTDDVSRFSARFIAGLDKDIPYSLLGFHPDYLLTDLPPTPREQVDECYNEARRHLSRVNVGNLQLL